MCDAMRSNNVHLAGSGDSTLPSGLSRSFLELLCLNISGGLLGGYIQDGFPLYCVNDYMIEHLGYKDYSAFAADIGGLVFNGIHPEDRDTVGQQVGELLRAGQTYEVQYRMRRADGSYIWVNDVGRSVTDEQGRAVCLSTIRDITGAVQDKSVLLQREQAYDRLFESVVCGIVQYELIPDSGRVLFHKANPEAMRIFGYTPEQFAAKTDWDLPSLIYPEDRARILASAGSLHDIGDKDSFEYRLLQRDGSPCWIIGTAELIRGTDGTPLVQSVFMDINRRKKAELENLELLQRNRMSDELLRLALENTDVCVVYYYPQQRRMVVPARTSARYGWKPVYENTPGSLSDCVYPEDRDYVLTQFEEFDRKATASREFRTADGRAWVRVTLSAVERDADGNVIAAVGLVEDRTKQRQAESAHSALSQLNQEVLRSLDRLFFGVYRIDLRAGVIRAVRAPAEAEANGVTGEDSPYDVARLSTLYHPDDRAAFCHELSLETLRNLQAAGERSVEREYRRRIGSEYHWVSRMVYLNHADFGTESAIVVLTDISDRRRQEDVLHALGREYFAIYYVDLQEDTFQIMRSDPAVAGGLGIGRRNCYSSVIRQYVQSFVHPEDQAGMSAFCSVSSLRALTPAHPEFSRTFRKLVDGRYEWMQIRFILSSDGKNAPPLVTLAIRDVDEDIREQLETKQLLADALRRAENANSAKSDFLSKMSHDIRTPMNAIIGMTALAAANLGSTERVHDCLDKIALSSKHLLALINEVLDMSKIESGKLDLNIAKTSLPDLVESTLALVRPEVEGKSQRLRVNLERVEHEQVLCDTLRLQQVLVNILSNACKYTPEGGTIRLVIAEQPATLAGRAIFQLICRDNGVGMSEDFQKHLFEPFSRADDSRISHIGGTGLGMAIAYNLVRMMGGTIECRSALGAGTVFTVTLDLELAGGAHSQVGALADLPILVADDDAPSLRSTVAILNSIGMQGEGVLSGREALQKTIDAHHARRDYFAVILDWKMPDMDGLATARAIRAAIGPDMPIIILSAYDWSVIADDAREAGVDAFISKPLFRSRLTYLLGNLAHAPVAADAPPAADRQPVSLAGKRLLLVEDNALNQEIAQEFLCLAGAAVVTADNGQQALDRFAASPSGEFDAILMDIRMPVMDGYTATRAIRALSHPDAQTVPIIAMTADAFAEDVQRAKDAGMNAHIAKPIDMDKLLRLLRLWT